MIQRKQRRNLRKKQQHIYVCMPVRMYYIAEQFKKWEQNGFRGATNERKICTDVE